MNHYFVLCDQEKAYVERFTALLNERGLVPYQIEGMTDTKVLEEFCSIHKVEVLLIEEELYQKERHLPVERCFLLSSLPSVREAEGVLFKYQSVPDMLQKILSMPDETQLPNVSDLEIIGIYSPVRCCQKTLFALALGQILARERAVLYLNFEALSGLQQILGKAGEGDLSDILYLVQQGKYQKELWHERCIHTINNLDYILPPLSPMDLHCVEEAGVLSVVETLERCNYQTLILELHEEVPAFLPLLQKCHMIYMPVRDDILSKAQLFQYEQMMQSAGQKAVLQRTVSVKPPYYNGFGDQKQYVEQLVWGEFGDYVRSLLWGK